MKRVILLLIVILSIGSISALNETDFEMFCQNISITNFEQFQIPSYIPYSNEIFNFYILEENFSGGLELKDRKIVSVECEESEDQTYNIYIKNLEVVTEITKAENSFNLLKEKINSKEIEVKGTTFAKRFKFAFTKFVLKFF